VDRRNFCKEFLSNGWSIYGSGFDSLKGVVVRTIGLKKRYEIYFSSSSIYLPYFHIKLQTYMMQWQATNNTKFN